MSNRIVDTTAIIDLLEQLDALQEKVDGADPGTRPHTDNRQKRPSSEKAEVSRQLLYGAHLSHRLALAFEEQYHRFKGTIPED